MTFSVDESGEEYKFRIGKVGYEHCSPSKGPVSRVRPNNAWHFILFGRGTIETADGKMYKLKRGESFLLFEGEYYNYYPDPQDPWTYIWVELTGDNLEAMFRQCGFTKACSRKALSGFDGYVELLKSMKDAFDESDVQQMRTCAYLILIMSKCIEDVRRGSVAAQGARKRRQMRDILLYMNNNFNLPLTNEEIASENGLSVRSLTALFAEMMQMSPVQYMNAYRVAVACERFQLTDMNVAEVARWSGFDDVKYFSRVFKKEKGMSPQEYRKKKPDEDAFALVREREAAMMRAR